MSNITHTTCRICLRYGKKLGRLFDIFKSLSISRNISLIASVKLQKDDGLPRKICVDCLSELMTAVSFKTKCETSDKILHSQEKWEKSDAETSSTELPVPLELVKEENVSEDIEEEFGCCNTADTDLDIKEDEETDKIISEVKNEIKIEKPEVSIIITEAAKEPLVKNIKAVEVECHDCGGKFKSKCKLRVHWKKLHMLEKLICHHCKRTFKTFISYNKHLKRRPQNCLLASKTNIEGIGRSRVFHCKFCSFSTQRAHDFLNHSNIHTGDRPHYCNICSKGFSQLSSLDNHNENVHKMIKKEITCQYCGEIVKGRRRVHRHLMKHTRSPVQCDICKRMLKSKSTLIEHLKQHTGVKPFTCEQCAARFCNQSSLYTHRRLIHGKEKNMFKCDICGYQLGSHQSLKKHKLKHSYFSEVCDVCGRFYPTAEQLASHKKIHTKEKSLCLQCNKIFCNEKSLKRHKSTSHKHKQNFLKNTPVNMNPNTISVLKCKDEKIELEILPMQK